MATNGEAGHYSNTEQLGHHGTPNSGLWWGSPTGQMQPEARGQESLDESPKGNNTRDTRKEKKDGKGTYRGTFAFYYLQKRRTVSSRNLTVDAL